MRTFLADAAQAYSFAYFGVLIVVALLEWVAPRRPPGDTLGGRWFGNFTVTILGSLLARATLPVAGAGWAVFCAEHGWGLLNAVEMPLPVGIAVSIVVLDSVGYAQHRLLHAVPLLWRLHRMHHTDQEFDFSTGVRFHPFENVFSTSVSLGAIAVLGAPPTGVLASQVLTVAMDFLEHANVRIPLAVDRCLRLVLVTPDMHRIHHSQHPGESRANFANTFSFWDRLLGTYIAQPAAGHEGIVFGVSEFADRKHLSLPWMLIHPFLSQKPEADHDGLGLVDGQPSAGRQPTA